MSILRKESVVLLLVLLSTWNPLAAANRLFIAPQSVMVGQTNVAVPVSLDNDQILYGFSLSLSTDATRLKLTGLDLVGTVAPVPDAEWSFGQALGSGARISWGVVLDISDPFDVNKVVPVGQALRIANLRLDVTSPQATQVAINFQDFPANYQADPPDPGAKNKLLRENGVGVAYTTGAGIINITGPVEGVGPFLRGDCNQDGSNVGQVTDAVFLLSFLFLGGPPPVCLAACDFNFDGQVPGSPTDALYYLNFNFLGGPPMADPLRDCARSTAPTDMALGCADARGCP